METSRVQSWGSAVESPLLSSLEDGGLSTRATTLGTALALGNTLRSTLLPLLLLLSSIDVALKASFVQ